VGSTQNLLIKKRNYKKN